MNNESLELPWFKKTIGNRHFIVAMEKLRSSHGLCGQHLHRIRTNAVFRGEVESFEHIFMEYLRRATRRSDMLSRILKILPDGPINYNAIIDSNKIEIYDILYTFIVNCKIHVCATIFSPCFVQIMCTYSFFQCFFSYFRNPTIPWLISVYGGRKNHFDEPISVMNVSIWIRTYS